MADAAPASVLTAYVERWLRLRAHRYAPRSLAAYRSVLRHHVLPALGDRPLDAITTRDVRRLLEGVLAHQAVNTAKQVLGALSAIFADAKLDGLVAANPAHGAGERLWPARGERPVHALTAAQLAGLLATAMERGCPQAPLFLVLARTGLRLGEGLALEPDDLLGDERAIRVDETYEGAGRFGPPKGGRQRIVDCRLSAQAWAVLVERAQRGGRLFRQPGAAQPWSLSTVDVAFRRVGRAAGLPGHLTPHSLRHTYATTLLMRGESVQYVQQQLGHSSIRVTVDIYGSWLRARPSGAVESLDDDGAWTRGERRTVRAAPAVPAARVAAAAHR